MEDKRGYVRPNNSRVDKKDIPILRSSQATPNFRKNEPVSEPESQPKNNVPEKENPEHNRIARNLFLVLGFFVVLFVAWMIISYNQARFQVEGVTFEKVKEIAPYRTSIPTMVGGGKVTGGVIQNTDYYFYLRNDPKNLKDIVFNGTLNIKKDLVVRSDKNFNCDGDGVIGVANLAKLYEFIGTKVIADKNATCDQTGKYMFLSLEEGNKTEIDQYGPSCYRMVINGCEILKATERFMVETFAEVKNKTA